MPDTLADSYPITSYMTAIVLPTVADVHRRFGDHVDREDLVQEAAVWWYGKGHRYLAEYLTEDEHFVRIRRSLWRYIAAYAQTQKAQRVGFSAIDQYRYAPKQLLALIPVAMDPDGIPEVGGSPDAGPAPKGNLAEGGDILASLVDTRRALAALDEDDLHFIQLVVDCRQDFDLVAPATGTLPDSARRRYARIVRRMARWLNNEINEEN